MFERFDIDLNDETDDLMESIDDMIFDEDDDDMEFDAPSIGEKKPDEDDDDDTISEEDLEKLLIGIDEENGILDIPDEEEVFEELKFVEELPKAKSKKKEKPSSKKPKEKKEKPEKTPVKFNMPTFDLTEFKENVFKYKYHIVAGFVLFFVVTGVSIKLILGKKDKVVTEVYQDATVSLANIPEEVIEENLSKEEQLAVYRGKLKEEAIADEQRELIQAKIKDVEEGIREEKKEEIKNYVKDLRSDYTEELKSVKPTVFKINNQNLIIGFVIKDEKPEEINREIYLAIKNAFEKNENVTIVNVNVFAVEDQLRKKMEISASRYEFDRVKDGDQEDKDKLLAFQVIKR